MSLISVLIPVYNVEKFVQDAILSISNQSYKNLEIIVVDDCSTDNTYSIVEKIAQQDKRIKLYRNNTNLKLVSTLNKALEYATGKYIIRMDGDDVCTYDRIDKMYNFLQNNPDYALVGSQTNSINEMGEIIGTTKLPTTFEQIKKTCIYSSPILHIWMCKKELYSILGGYRNILGAEDYDFLLRVLSSGYKITNLDEILYSVRIRQGNTITTIGIQQMISHDYCLGLYRERLYFKKNIDSYDENYLEIKLNHLKGENAKFLKAYEKFQISLKMFHKHNPFFLVFLIYSAIISRYIRKYIYQRIMYRIKK